MKSSNLSARIFNLIVLFAMLLGAALPAGVQAADEPVLPAQPNAPYSNTALQFNGTSQYVTFGSAISPHGWAIPIPTWTTGYTGLGGGLQFNGTNQYVSFGPTSILGLSVFTLEAWIYRSGAGATTSTGTGGLAAAVPLVSKGRGEAEDSNLDMNYFMGICGTVLCADFEQNPGGGNHPVIGTIPIVNNTWTHVAVTYDLDQTWRLYVNGVLDVTEAEGAAPRSDSIQHAGLATAMTSNGTAAGFFQGVLDEVRIWNYARSQSEISTAMATPIELETGLAARYSLDDGSGGGVTDTAYTGLGVCRFTIETWFYRETGGTSVSTGTGGIVAYPMVTKGAGEADGSNVDMDFFFGIDTAGRLAADFEEGRQPPNVDDGLNHPVTSTVTIAVNEWHHGAVTYDGQTWRLYIDGVLDRTKTLTSAVLPRCDSIQHAGLGTNMNSTGSRAGYFKGSLDEVRIWNYVRSDAEIAGNMNVEITTPQFGLWARWGLEEGSATVVGDSSGRGINGTTNATWVTGVFVPPFPPSAPTNLQACPYASDSACVTWTDTSSNETSFILERSTDNGVTWPNVTTLAANTVIYLSEGLTPESGQCYRVKASNAHGDSDYAGPVCITLLPAGERDSALTFNGSSSYVLLPTEAAGVTNFTVEAWINWGGGGAATTTGSGGINAIPVFAKGAQQADGSNVDMNFFLGIDTASNTIGADFEDNATGLNHPVSGVAPITPNTWHHIAATYDGQVWKLYLDGVLDKELNLGAAFTPRSDNVQPGGIATSMNLTNGTNGFFQGSIDEVRLWNRALTQAEIQANINHELAAPYSSDLVWYYPLDEGTGSTVTSASGAPVEDGTVTGTGWSWMYCGTTFNVNLAPAQPTLVNPADDATGIPASPSLQVTPTDPEGANLTVTFYGRQPAVAGPDFTFIAIPDTQYYASAYPAIFTSQTQWIANQKTLSNIAFAASLGDNVDSATTAQYNNADAAYDILDAAGVPYDLEPGNHDGAPGSTALYNSYFGDVRFSGKPWYGGYYGSDYDNHYSLFSASGMDFIVIFIEYDDGMTATSHPVLVWANNLLSSNSARRGIVISHNILTSGNALTPQGQAIYDALKGNANFDLLLGGHLDVASRQSLTYNGNTTHILRSDYQTLNSQQSGFLRIMRFSPAVNKIFVSTYSPYRTEFYTTDPANNQFELDYPMSGPFASLGSVVVPSGSLASLTWPGLENDTLYEWYVTVSDGVHTTTSPVWSFTTESPTAVRLLSLEARSGGFPWLLLAALGLLALPGLWLLRRRSSLLRRRSSLLNRRS